MLRRVHLRELLLCLLMPCSAACGSAASSTDGSTDAGSTDAAEDARDASTGVDAGAGGAPGDAGLADSGAPDSTVQDSGSADAGLGDSGPHDSGLDDAGGSGTPAAFQVDMTYTTANIGRDYSTRAQVAVVFDRVADDIGAKSGPRFIGWQEIGEGDPCGNDCEIEELEARFSSGGSWDTRRPRGERPDGGKELVKVPVTSKGASADIQARAAFASPGWANVSPTRFVTVVRYPGRNLSLLNTHLIAGAWSCKSSVAQRKDYWKRGWDVLKAEVAAESQAGWNVIVTGDLNRGRSSDSCNPAWDPESLHARARIIGGAGIDYVFAVPAKAWRFAYARRADNSIKQGTISLGIDGHSAHWVTGRFTPE